MGGGREGWGGGRGRDGWGGGGREGGREEEGAREGGAERKLGVGLNECDRGIYKEKREGEGKMEGESR